MCSKYIRENIFECFTSTRTCAALLELGSMCSILILLVYYIGTLLLEGKSRCGSLETGIVFFSCNIFCSSPACVSSSTVLTRETTFGKSGQSDATLVVGRRHYFNVGTCPHEKSIGNNFLVGCTL